MTPYTQTSLDPGNCWQTCVASILDIEPETMPSQAEVLKDSSSSYFNHLNVFLEKHFNVLYNEIWDHVHPALQVRDPGWHLMLGPTVRSEANGGVHHAVVGRYGQFYFDPHPSRAGLLYVERWGLLCAIPERVKLSRDKWRRDGDPDMVCRCPACKESP